ncbi:molybdate ABC transporter substrate-binding protein [Ornithinimicrobium cavernae]|uniref:molybdate ABC transporter substrate-binding protein n=1 Tax=Ornithinimicrobium cavernae TaxID=2666047 RepID=UPI000D685E37|nr:molybdate ABC transporter substrate-binding protein [Ornithinimicrobium cavernae]
MPRHRPVTTAGPVLALLLTGCGEGSAPDAGHGPPGEITVFAAASLSGAFTELGEQFEDAHPGATVTFGFAGSSTLAHQVLGGAPTDVLATASPETMGRVTRAGLVEGDPAVFARNSLQIAVPAGNPGGVRTLADLTREELTIALCAPEVPCGAAAAELLAAAGLTAAPDTYEDDVRAALTRVRLDEVDAALVYRTDILAAGADVEGLEVPGAGDAANDYPIAVLTGAPDPDGATAFVDFVLSASGREVLGEAGFDLP